MQEFIHYGALSNIGVVHHVSIIEVETWCSGGRYAGRFNCIIVFVIIVLWGRSSSQIPNLLRLLETELVWHTTVCDQGVENNSRAEQYEELLHWF